MSDTREWVYVLLWRDNPPRRGFPQSGWKIESIRASPLVNALIDTERFLVVEGEEGTVMIFIHPDLVEGDA